MISFLEGTIEFKAEKFVVVNVSGVGYKVFVSTDTLAKIPEKMRQVNVSDDSPKVKLWTHQHVREDTLDLYGFLHFAELELFELLLSVSGIGPKGALGVLAVASVDALKKAIAAGDTSYLVRVSGIGRKTAERIIIELKEKMAGRGVTVEAPELKEEADALDALIALGYSSREAHVALENVPTEITSAEKRIRAALRMLGEKK